MRELVHQMLEELQEERVGGFFEDVFRGEAEGYSPPVAQAPFLGLSG
ncbi:MAG: hypothetical protein QXR12_04045 [Thermofilum sp.]